MTPGVPSHFRGSGLFLPFPTGTARLEPAANCRVGRLFLAVSLPGIARTGHACRLRDRSRQVVRLLRQVSVDATDHRRVAVPHQFRQRRDVDAVQDAVGAESVSDLVGTKIIPEPQLPAEPLHLKSNGIGRPLLAVAVDENVSGRRPAAKKSHEWERRACRQRFQRVGEQRGVVYFAVSFSPSTVDLDLHRLLPCLIPFLLRIAACVVGGVFLPILEDGCP